MQKELLRNVVDAIQNLDSNYLADLDPTANYSYCDKEYFVKNLEKQFEEIKQNGISFLNVRKSKCQFCYPYSHAYSFHHPVTDEFIIRYVIHQEDSSNYFIEECKNKPIETQDDGLPF